MHQPEHARGFALLEEALTVLFRLTNRAPIAYELTPANVAEVGLVQELLAEANLGNGFARKLLEDLAYHLAYRSGRLKEALAEAGNLLVIEQVKQRRGARQQVEIALSSLKRVFRLGETLATTLMGLATRIAAKITACTYAFMVNRRLGRPREDKGVVGVNLAADI